MQAMIVQPTNINCYNVSSDACVGAPPPASSLRTAPSVPGKTAGFKTCDCWLREIWRPSCPVSYPYLRFFFLPAIKWCAGALTSRLPAGSATVWLPAPPVPASRKATRAVGCFYTLCSFTPFPFVFFFSVRFVCLFVQVSTRPPSASRVSTYVSLL